MRVTLLIIVSAFFFASSSGATPPQVGVVPFSIKGKGKKTRRILRANAAQYFTLFTSTLSASRPDIALLNNPKEKILKSRSPIATIKKRAKAVGVQQVIGGSVRGLGKRQLLTFTLYSAEGKKLGTKVVKPYNQPAAKWTADVLAAFIEKMPAIPEPEPEPEPETTSTAEAEAGAGETPETLQIDKEAQASSLKTPLITTGIVLGVTALVSGGAWAYFGTTALSQSNELVSLPKDSARRKTLEDSSIFNAKLSDGFTVATVVLGVAGVVVTTLGFTRE